jgi:DNA-binding MarR family transcriptional regulator
MDRESTITPRGQADQTPEGSTDARSSEATAERSLLLDRAAELILVLPRLMRLIGQEFRAGAAFERPAPGLETVSARPSAVTSPGFAEAQYLILYLLVTDGALPVGEIADRCHVAVPTISKLLNHLEEQGQIERHIDRTNRRVVHVQLTEAGRAAYARMRTRAKAAIARAIGPLTDAQLADLIVGFGHLSALVDATHPGD